MKSKKIFSLALIVVIIGTGFLYYKNITSTNCSPKEDLKKYGNENAPVVALVMNDCSELVFVLDPSKAPNTVANFVQIAKDGDINGTVIHRIEAADSKIPLIQGGGYKSEEDVINGKGMNSPTIKGEFKANEFAQNDSKHEFGTISMARTSEPNSASTQFFVMGGSAPMFDDNYAAFGKLANNDGKAKLVDMLNTTTKKISDVGTKYPNNELKVVNVRFETFGKEYNPERTPFEEAKQVPTPTESPVS